MSLRPVPARWFEVIVDQNDCSYAMEALAATGRVQLEAGSEKKLRQRREALREPLEIYRQLARDYAAFWPEPAFDQGPRALSAELAASEAVSRLTAWQADAEAQLDALQVLEKERADLQLWQYLLVKLSRSQLNFEALGQSGPFLAGLCLLLPDAVDPSAFLELLSLAINVDDQLCVLAVVPQEEAARLCRQAEALQGRCLKVPRWFQPGVEKSLNAVQQRLREVDPEIRRVKATLSSLDERHELAGTLGELQRLEWFVSHAEALSTSENFVWITGWTSEPDERRLTQVLETAGVRALLHFPAVPKGVSAPSLLTNPRWARPFEVFIRALGIPARNEADPSLLLAVIVPLLFGYMFGDVGHGLVLIAVGLWLRKRGPLARLLLVCGASAVVFGFVFGGFFGREDLLPALWLHPLSSPLLVLGVPLVGGVVIMTLGLVLNAVQSCWQKGEGTRWLGDVGLLVTYLGLMAGFFDPLLFLVALVGVVLCVVHRVWLERSFRAVLSSLGQLLEKTMQLLMNTLSFIRVGAFALGHAGLSLAIVSLADSVPSAVGASVIMIIGNGVIVALEGLVVSIQTTRLVLFEFFIRFFRGQGRSFQPLPLPPSAPRGKQHESKD